MINADKSLLANLNRDIAAVLRNYGIAIRSEIKISMEGEDTLLRQPPWKSCPETKNDIRAEMSVSIAILGEWHNADTRSEQ